jgi:hypothetical protein
MSSSLLPIVGSTFLLVSSNLTHANCAPGLSEQIVTAERIIDSLRPEKSGQVRVFAVDGSEYTAGEAQWMKGKLRSMLRACAQGDEVLAASTLQSVTDLLRSHHSVL